MNIIEARTGSTTEDLMSHDDARQRRMATHLSNPMAKNFANRLKVTLVTASFRKLDDSQF